MLHAYTTAAEAGSPLTHTVTARAKPFRTDIVQEASNLMCTWSHAHLEGELYGQYLDNTGSAIMDQVQSSSGFGILSMTRTKHSQNHGKARLEGT